VAIRGLEAASRTAAAQLQGDEALKLEAFVAVLGRDARNSSAVVDLVLAQPAISSQLIDNLNASIHLRALLTDLFLITEIVAAQQVKAAS